MAMKDNSTPGRKGTSNRGFASMDPNKQKEIASKGGQAAHAQGTAHEFTPEEAQAAGRKGGEVVSRDRSHMAAIGRKGGEISGRKRQQRAQSSTAAGSQSAQQGTRPEEAPRP